MSRWVGGSVCKMSVVGWSVVGGSVVVGFNKAQKVLGQNLLECPKEKLPKVLFENTGLINAICNKALHGTMNNL